MVALLLIIGLFCLYYGAEFLVKGSSSIALLFGISPLVIGLTLVALGTSSPEIVVTAITTVQNESNLTLGNLIGSNIFNTLFILGVAALISPLQIHRSIIRSEALIVVIVSGIIYALSLKGSLNKWDGLFLIAISIGYMWYLIKHKAEQEVEPIKQAKKPLWMIFLCLAGLTLLIIGAELVVNSAITIATMLGLSTLVIGLTIVAAGTSLPELATAAIASYRKESDLAIGNIIGSNIYNITLILGIGCLLSKEPIPISGSIINLDLPILLFSSTICLPIFLTGEKVTRLEGAFLVLVYLLYVTYLVI